MPTSYQIPCEFCIQQIENQDFFAGCLESLSHRIELSIERRNGMDEKSRTEKKESIQEMRFR
jgi:hypothetical protein